MKRDHSKISATAFNHIIFRTFYGIPMAREFFEAAEKFSPRENIFNEKMLREMSPVFEGRYKSGEAALENFIKKNPDCIVLEFAAGFSLHGAVLAGKHSDITYIETDLPDVISLKEKIVKKIGAGKKNLLFQKANALDRPALWNIFQKLKKNSKIAFYCEGLLSYFSDAEKEKFAKITKYFLDKYGGVLITPDSALDAEARIELTKILPGYRRAMRKAEKIAGQKYDDHGFRNADKTDEFFKRCGFRVTKNPWPGNLKSFEIAGTPKKDIPKLKNFLRKYDRVWILTSVKSKI